MTTSDKISIVKTIVSENARVYLLFSVVVKSFVLGKLASKLDVNTVGMIMMCLF